MEWSVYFMDCFLHCFVDIDAFFLFQSHKCLPVFSNNIKLFNPSEILVYDMRQRNILSWKVNQLSQHQLTGNATLVNIETNIGSFTRSLLWPYLPIIRHCFRLIMFAIWYTHYTYETIITGFSFYSGLFILLMNFWIQKPFKLRLCHIYKLVELSLSVLTLPYSISVSPFTKVLV